MSQEDILKESRRRWHDEAVRHVDWLLSKLPGGTLQRLKYNEDLYFEERHLAGLLMAIRERDAVCAELAKRNVELQALLEIALAKVRTPDGGGDHGG